MWATVADGLHDQLPPAGHTPWLNCNGLRATPDTHTAQFCNHSGIIYRCSAIPTAIQCQPGARRPGTARIATLRAKGRYGKKKPLACFH